MKTKLLILLTGLIVTASCNSGDDSKNKKDSGNTLNDTFPASRHVDSVALDSNPPDATYIDSLHKSTR